ncbi:PLC-like phosphodiesterase [Mycena olivaceomarginata]|nr:PLC-like phosphodiesterase [Mycena olivaceomarginata]
MTMKAYCVEKKRGLKRCSCSSPSSSLLAIGVSAASQQPLARPFAFDVQAIDSRQGHRGGRGNAIENTLPSFAWGLIDGATTLELDNGVTKDGVVVVWHDEQNHTAPAFSDDAAFPYVGKFIANLTLAQLKTLDCGSQRQSNFPLQLTYPGTRISTLQEVFDFVECADADHLIRWNIESKIDAAFPDRTVSVDVFVKNQHAIFDASPYKDSINSATYSTHAQYQSFDWRSLIAMKKLDPTIITSALVEQVSLVSRFFPPSSFPCSDTAVRTPDNTVSPWLGGLNLQNFSGSSLGVKLANAAHSINATHYPGDACQALDCNLDMADELLRWGVDGIITDYPNMVRRWVQQQGRQVAPKYPKRRVLACLDEHSRW